jgi:hypothetical protein
LERDGGHGGDDVIIVSDRDDEPDLYLWFGDTLAPSDDFELVGDARQDIPELIAAIKLRGHPWALAQLSVSAPEPIIRGMRRTVERLVWACVCLVVWPIYHAAWFINWLLYPFWAFWPSNRQGEFRAQLYEQLLSPPFITHLRQ